MILGSFMRGSKTTSIEFVGVTATQNQTVPIPAHQPGDLLIICAARAATSSVGIPSGWTSYINSFLSGLGWRIGYKIAASSSETSGTWTNSQRTCCIVYRGAVGLGSNSTDNSTSGFPRWPALTPSNPPKLMVGFMIALPTILGAGSVGQAVVRTTQQTGSVEMKVIDTDIPISGFTSKLDAGSLSGNWRSYMIEVL